MDNLKFASRLASTCLLLLSATAYAQTGCTISTTSPMGTSVRFGPAGSNVTVTDARTSMFTGAATVSFKDGSGRSHSTSTASGYQFRSSGSAVTWTFSPAVPAHRIGVSLSDLGGINYQYSDYPASMRLSVSGGATRADFEVLQLGTELLALYDSSTGLVTKNLAGPSPTASHGAFLRGTSERLVSSLSVTAPGLFSADFVQVNLISIPNCVTVRKATEYGTGTFDFTLSSNLKNFVGTTAANSTALTTTVESPTSFVASSYFFPDEVMPLSGVGSQDVVIAEPTLPTAYWKLKSVSCTDWNASRTGNTGTFGTLVNGTITIPGDRVRFESNIVCDYVNQQQVANVTVVKTNATDGSADSGTDTLLPGASTQYSIVASNSGPLAADGALIRDEVAAGLTCSTAQCSGTTGGAVCPSTTLAALTGSGVTISTFPANSSVTFQVACTAPAAP